MRVLVAYASKHGATKGIADHIGNGLRHSGHAVDVRPAETPGDPSAYDAFVIGSAAYAGHWLRPARSMVRKNKELLSHKPVWLFSSGPLGEAVDAKGRDQREASVPKEAAEFEAIHPRDFHVFFGALDVDKLSAWERALPKMIPALRRLMPEGDYRDWQDIDGWTDSIAHELESSDRQS